MKIPAYTKFKMYKILKTEYMYICECIYVSAHIKFQSYIFGVDQVM